MRLNLHFVFKPLAISFLFFLTLTSCGGNSLSPFTQSQNSTEALYVEIEKKLNISDFDGVVDLIIAQSAGFQTLDRVKYYLGNAYLGKCGFGLSTFSEKYGSVTASQMFQKYAYSFTGVTVDPPSCGLAQAAFESIADDSSYGSKKAFSLLMVGFSKIGTYLKSDLDQDDDGVAEKDPCLDTDLSDADAKQVISGMGLILNNFSGIVGDILGAESTSDITNFQTACEGVLGVGNCSITDANSSTIDPTMIAAFRFLLDSSNDGFGTCDTTEITPADGDGIEMCCVPGGDPNP
ncbi:MAG TPA: hypothetical protein PLJ21_11810 [Pseudobdellovibrionaceae bacterium]|nr:hypothetical protein [Pseudobdellovibrionaceae bacterium]